MEDSYVTLDSSSTQIVESDPWRRAVVQMQESFADDPLYKSLISEDRVLVFTDELRQLASGALLSTREATAILNGLDWLNKRNVRVTDAMVRSWFQVDVGLEEYINPVRNGRNRGYDIEALVRLKLLCLWRYEKNASTQRIHEMVYGPNTDVEPREWLPVQVEALVGKHLKSLYMEFQNQLEQRDRQIDAYQHRVHDLESQVRSLYDGVNNQGTAIDEAKELQLKNASELFAKMGETSREVATMKTEVASARDLQQIQGELTRLRRERQLEQEALSAWGQQGEKRFQKGGFLGLRKTEDVMARNRFIQEYVASRINGG